MDAAFDLPRTARSAAYKAGTSSKLSFKLEGIPMVCPYVEGSAEFDAFHAGVDEANAILRARS